MKWLANLKPFPKNLRIHWPPCTFFCWQFQLNVRVLSAPVVCCGEDQETKAVSTLSALLLIWNQGACECMRCGHFWTWIYRYNHVFQLGGTNSRLLHMEFALTCLIICYVLSHLAPYWHCYCPLLQASSISSLSVHRSLVGAWLNYILEPLLDVSILGHLKVQLIYISMNRGL